jgi:uncharacterized protein YjbI with pentapeptide repeats
MKSQNAIRRRAFDQSQAGTLESGEAYARCDFDGLSLKHCDLANCAFESCSFKGTDLNDARLNGCEFSECDLSNAKLAGSNLFAARFDRCKLLGVVIAGCQNLATTKISKCIFDYVQFRGLSLEGMRFVDCSFIEADLSLTILKKTAFTKCNLEGVDWTGAEFDATDLRGSKLTGLHLCKVNLAGVILSVEQCADLARELGITVLP